MGEPEKPQCLSLSLLGLDKRSSRNCSWQCLNLTVHLFIEGLGHSTTKLRAFAVFVYNTPLRQPSAASCACARIHFPASDAYRCAGLCGNTRFLCNHVARPRKEADAVWELCHFATVCTVTHPG